MITAWPGATDSPMPEEILLGLGEMMDRHPWWRHRCSMSEALLRGAGVHPPALVLDAGCGTGLNLRHLEDRGYRVVGLDASRPVLERLDGARRHLVHADLSAPPPAGVEPFDAVLLLDVLEHLDDEAAALRTVSSLLARDGTLVISVPARADLFSEFDRIQGHRRRYQPEMLHAVIEQAGLEVIHLHWWGAWMVPLFKRRPRREDRSGAPAEVYRTYLSLPPLPVRWLLDVLFAVDGWRTLRGRSRSGTSLFAVAKRAPSAYDQR